MEEIGKLIHELFDDLKKENTKLKDRCWEMGREIRKLEKVTDIISALVVKSTNGEWYMQSLWGREFDKLVDLLGLELKEEEEE